jgi:ribonuclease HI
MACIELWTDGSCYPNPGGPGGWAYVLEMDGERRVGSGGVRTTTNNRMELQAVIAGLRALPAGTHTITLHTDSQYVRHIVTGTKLRKKNSDMAQTIKTLVAGHTVTVNQFRGHMGLSANNDVCDELAGRERKAMRAQIVSDLWA